MCICRAFMLEEVKVYLTPTCAESRDVRWYLERKGIRYEALDVSVDKEALGEMIRLSGQETLPVITIGDRIFVGFNKAELDKAIP